MARKLDDKYFSTKPLKKGCIESYPDKYRIQYHEFEEPKALDLWEAIRGNKLELSLKPITFGVKGSEKGLLKYDFLHCSDGPAFVAKARVIDRLNKLCPNDFQALPVKIKNLTDKQPVFINKDYYLINILNLVDAIDQDKTIIEYSNHMPWIYNLMFKDNPMKGHLLARDSLRKSFILFHPILARELLKFKGLTFYSDIEDGTWIRGKGKVKS